MNDYTPKSDYLNISIQRGLFHQCSDLEALDKQLLNGVVSAYIGFDCTAPSFHIGNLVQIMRLYWLQQTGHRPIPVMGGGTSRVGDPSGKDETRRLLTIDKIAENMQSLKQTFGKFMRFGEGPTDALMVDNAEWLEGLNYIQMLRDVGQHFSVNRMLSMDTVRSRLERQQEMSFLEFNYMVLQAYDFVELNRRYGCLVQMGGSDQWGNIVTGIDLGRRMGTPQLFALTCPLITTADGAKMGKTANGAIWLKPELFSPYNYWQFWRNVDDKDVGRFLRLFTTLPLPDIAKLEKLRGAEINEAKKVLATEATALLHGVEEAKRASHTSDETFASGGMSEGLPTLVLERRRVGSGLAVAAVFVEAKLASSLADARRKIAADSLRVNNKLVVDQRAVLSVEDISPANTIKLSMGKKQHALISVVDGEQ